MLKQLILFLSFSLIFNSCSDSNDSSDLSAPGESRLVVTGNAGVAYVSSNNSSFSFLSWNNISLDTTENIVDLACNGSNLVAATTSSIYYSDDFGNNWTKSDNTFSALTSIAFGDDTFVITDNFAAYYSTDSGKSWQASSNSTAILFTNAQLLDIAFGNGLFVIINNDSDLIQSAGGIAFDTANAAGGNRVQFANDHFFTNPEVFPEVSNLAFTTTFGASSPIGTEFVDNTYLVFTANGDLFFTTDLTNYTSTSLSITPLDSAYDGIYIYLVDGSSTIHNFEDITSGNTGTYEFDAGEFTKITHCEE